MDITTHIPANTPSETFGYFIWGNRQYRIILWIAAAAMVIQFGVFKYIYPYASYIHGDSFVYLNIAQQNLNIDAYLVGYGRFLRMFSVFGSSDLVLTAFQYLLLQGSALFLLFTLFYFNRPSRRVQHLLLAFMVLNPLFLGLANLISSDGLFVALSLSWFALLLWIMHRPNNIVMVCHALVVFAAFTVRYNALIYPGIALIAFLLSPQSWGQKMAGAAVGIILCGLFVLYNGHQYKKLTGTWQYSPFSGWLMANNAMYAYRYVDSADRKPVPQRFKVLDNMIRTYFDSSRDVKTHPVEGLIASTAYMWTPSLPLYVYRERLFKKDSRTSEVRKWASMGPLYGDYGRYIIRKYPLQYARYFLWPNVNKYYAPPLEFLETYNSGRDSVQPVAQQWFGYKSNKVKVRSKTFQAQLLGFYPIFSGIINVVMLCLLLCFVLLKGFREHTLFRKGVLMGGGVWLLNAGFTIFASSAALRFQAFPILLTSTFTLLLLDWLWQKGLEEKRVTVQQSRQEPISASYADEAIEPGEIHHSF
ncbi:hypothetical protein [Chitinophaga sp. GbtcB8]|uniref:hypothetical protein n=1 Tax=Chitinophaga sp. GbtcB8 TaxID=2824753 RepID=UPI001C30E358|nr:hypothetical protein [Chitinophaga sp. GbtcB8]